MIYVLALLMGVVAGLRAMMAPAVVCWAARFGVLGLGGTRLAFLGHGWVPWIFTCLALLELVTDQMAKTPSRTVPSQFGARMITGGLSGAAVGLARGSWAGGAAAGIAGAVIGTLVGHAARGRAAAAFGRDRPAALIEDGVAFGGAVLIMAATAW